MGKLVRLKSKTVQPPETLISRKPWEFRRADWETAHFIQMRKSRSRQLERRRTGVCAREKQEAWRLPPHYILDGGVAYTIRALFAHRDNETRMRDVYYLAGLMDCLINQVNPVLRTDLLRDMYNQVYFLKSRLNINWYGPLDKVLLPLNAQCFPQEKYRTSLYGAVTLKDLYRAIRRGTYEMFDIISHEYVIYCPSLGKSS
jgi:hypothetical protein